MSKALVSGGLFAATVLVMAGAAQAQTIRAQPVDRSRRRRGTSTSNVSWFGSGGADVKPCRVSAARPVIIASP